MSDASRQLAGILFVVIPTIEFGGWSLLRMIARRIPGYLDNPVRQNLFRAGHAHAGVLVLLALVGILYVDQTGLSSGTRTLVRTGFALAPILISAGFFLSVIPPRTERPIRMNHPGLRGRSAAGGGHRDPGREPALTSSPPQRVGIPGAVHAAVPGMVPASVPEGIAATAR